MKRPEVSLIIPTLNEAKNLSHVLNALPDSIDELIIVDGGSTDGTVDLVKKLRPGAKVVNQDGRGKGNAMKCGLRHASGDYILLMDSDYSHDPGELPRLLEKLQEGYDVAHGSRFLPGGGSSDLSLFRTVGNRLFILLTNLLFGTHYTDVCYGLMGFQKAVFERISISTDDIVAEAELLCKIAKAKLRVAEVPSFERRRLHGQSSYNGFRVGWNNLVTIIKERFRGSTDGASP